MENILEAALTASTRYNGQRDERDFSKALILEPVEAWRYDNGTGKLVFRYETAGKNHRNLYGTMHGGIIASVLDVAVGMSMATLTKHVINTVDLHISYLRAGVGEHYRIEVEVTHLGRRLGSANMKLIDVDNDELVATGQATFFIFEQILEVFQEEEETE